MADFEFDNSITLNEALFRIRVRTLMPKQRPTLSQSSYVLAGITGSISGQEMLRAVSKARFTARDAETILGIPRNTLIRKAAELGVPFNSKGTTRSRARQPSTFNAYAPLGKPAAAKPAASGAPAANANAKPAEQPAPKPVMNASVPDTAKPLTEVPDGGCEQYLGTRGGVPVYCAQKPATEIPRRDGPIFRCAAHRSSNAKAKLG